MNMLLPKSPRLRDPKYLVAVRDMRCVITGDYGNDYMSVVPAHLRFASGGMGLKPHDNHVLPLRADLHQLQHTMPELEFWRVYLTDELLVAALTALAERLHAEWRDR